MSKNISNKHSTNIHIQSKPLGQSIEADTQALTTRSIMTIKDSITDEYTDLEGENGNLIISTQSPALGDLSSTVNDSTQVEYTRSVLMAKDQNDVYQNVRSNYSGEMIVENRTYPETEGLSFKLIRADGTVGHVVDNKRVRGQELVQEQEITTLTKKSCVPLLQGGDFIKIITTQSTPQLSSSSTADSFSLATGCMMVLVQGWVADPITFEWSVGVDLFQLNGQTPVTGLFGTQFVGWIGSQAVLTGSNVPLNSFDQASAGNMYFTESGEPLTAGVPTAGLNDTCYAVARSGSAVFYHSYVVTPPGHQTFWHQHILGAVGTSNASISILAEYYIRTTSIAGLPNSQSQECAWKRAALLTLQSSLANTSPRQDSFPDLNASLGNDLPNYIQILHTRINGNTDAIQLFSNLSGQFSGDASYGI